MQAKNQNPRDSRVLTHPEESEWMDLLYCEAPPARKRELETHLKGCPACAQQIEQWRRTGAALNEWKLPARKSHALHLPAYAAWAAAAAILLFAGFAIGRQASVSKSEVQALKNSYLQLAQRLEQQALSNAANFALAARTANEQTAKLLQDYDQLQQAQRAEDRRSLTIALASFHTDFQRLQLELETVAFNTENSFEQTHQNISELVSLATPNQDSARRP